MEPATIEVRVSQNTSARLIGMDLVGLSHAVVNRVRLIAWHKQPPPK